MLTLGGRRAILRNAKLTRNSGICRKRSATVKKSPNVVLKQKVSTANEQGSQISKIDEIVCNGKYRARKIGAYFDPWYWLVKSGMKRNKVIKIRRKLKKFAYPWLFFAFPTALYMLIGDTIAQICLENADKNKHNIMRTLHYAAIGLFITGPLASKWSLFWLRRLPRHQPPTFIAMSLILDIFFLAPVAIMITMVAFDYKYAMEEYKQPEKLFNERYKECFKEIMQFYILSRPLLGIASCFILPKGTARVIRVMYYIWFYTVMAKAMSNAKLGHYRPIEVVAEIKKGKLQEGCDCVKTFLNKYVR